MPHFIKKSLNTIENSKKIFYMGKNFKLTTFESETGIRIYLGGHSNIYCLEGFIYKDIDFNTSLIDKTVGMLVQVYYDQACSLEGDFEKGIDTRNLIHLFLSIVKKNFKHVTRIHLIDASTKLCDNGSEVSLSNMLYARRGKTWYEQHFKAVLDVECTTIFDNAVKRFDNAKDKFTWNTFSQFIKADLPIEQDKMIRYYENAKSWQQFFGSIANEIGDATFCEFVSPWLNDFMKTAFGFSFSMFAYHIPLIVYQPRLYSVLPFNNTGGSKTNRKRKFTIRRGRLEKYNHGSKALE
jgi:hypothetical protein